MADLSRLKGVAETLIVPLMGRALETRKTDGILNDQKALSIFEGLKYDYARFNDPLVQRSFLRTTVRTAIIDRLLVEFMEKHPDATVVEIGCGLNSRFERVDNGRVRWYDLDLPEVYDVWRSFFSETPRRHFLPFSAFDTAWMERVTSESSGPWFLISEASVIYFPEESVRALFKDLQGHFPGAHYLFDSATPGFIDGLKRSGDAIKLFNVNLGWGIDDIKGIREWVPTAEILETVNLENPGHRFSQLYPPGFKGEEGGYQLNLVRL